MSANDTLQAIAAEIRRAAESGLTLQLAALRRADEMARRGLAEHPGLQKELRAQLSALRAQAGTALFARSGMQPQ